MAAHFDAIVIGAGQAGPALARRLAGEGFNTTVIERKSFGGTCVNNGCIPTKGLSRAPARRTWRDRPAASASTLAGQLPST